MSVLSETGKAIGGELGLREKVYLILLVVLGFFIVSWLWAREKAYKASAANANAQAAALQQQTDASTASANAAVLTDLPSYSAPDYSGATSSDAGGYTSLTSAGSSQQVPYTDPIISQIVGAITNQGNVGYNGASSGTVIQPIQTGSSQGMQQAALTSGVVGGTIVPNPTPQAHNNLAFSVSGSSPHVMSIS